MKFRFFLILFSLLAFKSFAQNQIVNYSPNDNLSITSFKVSFATHRVAINIAPSAETVIYDLFTGEELKRLQGDNSSGKSIHFDEDRSFLIVESETNVYIYNSINYTKLGEYKKPVICSSSFYSSELGKFLFLEPDVISYLDVLDGKKESYPRVNPGIYFNELIKYSKNNSVTGQLTNGELIFYKDFKEVAKINGFKIVDFAFGENNVAVLKEFERSKPAIEFFDFNGNSLSKENRFNDLFLNYSSYNLQSINDDVALYGAFNDISILTKEGNPYKYRFDTNFKNYQFIYGLGFAINYGKNLDIVDFEGRPLFKFYVNTIHNQSVIYEQSDSFNEDKFVQINEDEIFFSHSSGDKKTPVKLQNSYVNNYSLDENLLGFVTRDNAIQVWDTKLEKETLRIETTGAYPLLLAISKSDNILAACLRSENIINIYNLSTNKIEHTLPFEDEVPTSIDLKNGWLAVGTSKGDYYTWKITNNTLTNELSKATGLGGFISSIKILDSEILIGGLGRIFTVPLTKSSLTNPTLYKGHESYIQDIITDKEKHFLLSSSIDGTLNLWDLKSSNLIETYILDSTWVNKLHFHKDFTISSNGPSSYGNVISKTELEKRMNNPRPELIIQSSNTTISSQLRFSPDGKLIASIDGKKIKVREVLTGFLISEFVTKQAVVNDFVFDSDGKSIIVASGKGIEFFDHVTGKSKKYLNYATRNRSIHLVEVFNKQNAIIATNIHGWHQPLFLHSNSGAYLGEIDINSSTEMDKLILNVKVSSDDKFIATYGSHYIKLFTVDDKLKTRQILAIPRKKEEVYNTYWNNIMDFSEDNNYFSYVEFDGNNSTIIYDIVNRKVVYNKPGKLSKFGKDQEILLMYGNTEIKLRNLNNEKDLFFQPKTSHIDLITAMAYDKNEELFATADAWGNIKIWNGKTGKTITEIDRFSNDVYASEISLKGDFIAYSNKNGIFLFNLKSFKTIRLKGNNYPYFGVFSKTKDFYYFRDGSNYMEIDLSTLKTQKLFDTGVDYKDASACQLSDDSELLFFEDKASGMLKIYDLKTREKIAEIDKANVSNYTGIASLQISGSTDYTLNGMGITKESDEELSIELFERNINSKKIKTFSHKRYIDLTSEFKDVNIKLNTAVNEVSQNKMLYAYQENYHLKVENLRTNQILYDKYIKGFNLKFGKFTKDNLYLILGFENGMIQVLSIKNFKVVKTFQGTLDDITKVDLNERFLMLLGANNKINVFDLTQDYKKVYSAAFIGDGEFVIINDQDYYYASKGAVKDLAFKKDINVYPFEQFDLYYNRPDKVANTLFELGIKQDNLSDAYYKAYLKRIKNIGFKEEQLSGEFHLPKLNIVNEIPVTINKDSLVISVLAKDDLYTLDRINVWINDVPIYGVKGKNVKQLNLKELQDDFKIALSPGSNKIQLSTTNSRGLESLKETIKVNCTQEDTKPALYLVSIGVSKYLNQDYNLEYAAKDALDISDYTESIKGEYSKIEITKLIDEEVTIENVLKVKDKLNQTNLSDVVIVFFAGHGILDSNFDYYLATHDIDFDNPSKRGLSYENLESLLDGIPARKKLLLMDACHSGEVDKDDIEKSNINNAENVIVTKRGAIVVKTKEDKVGLENSFELMQMLFADLRKGTGAMVISSAGGVEFAYEGEQWNNGVFTYALLQGLKSQESDANEDGKITVTELRDYVIENVYELTNGKQNPTSRKENLEFDFTVW